MIFFVEWNYTAKRRTVKDTYRYNKVQGRLSRLDTQRINATPQMSNPLQRQTPPTSNLVKWDTPTLIPNTDVYSRRYSLVIDAFIFIDAYDIRKRHLKQHKNDSIIA